MKINSISVIGLGYIGLPTAALFASENIKVVGVDIDQKAIELINKGKVHIKEPYLKEMVQESVNKGTFRAVIEPEKADVFIIAVPTPFQGENKKPDLSHVKSAIASITPVLKVGDLIVLESTSPVGTTEKIRSWISKRRPDLNLGNNNKKDPDLFIAYCPERVLPGNILHELVYNDRIIGGITPSCSMAAKELYQHVVKGKCIICPVRTAEMAKLAENSFRDINIAFANELSMICDDLEIDIWELISMTNLHPRVNILQPGAGVGGHCIAVDPWFIIDKSPSLCHLISTARSVNESKPKWIINKVKDTLDKIIQINGNDSQSDITIACYGLAYKPNISDLRESPALKIYQLLKTQTSCNIVAVEPNISQQNPHFKLVETNVALEIADIHILLVPHDEFKQIDYQNFSGKVLDFVGLYDVF